MGSYIIWAVNIFGLGYLSLVQVYDFLLSIKRLNITYKNCLVFSGLVKFIFIVHVLVMHDIEEQLKSLY